MKIKRMKKLIGGITLGVLLISQNIYASAYGNVNVSTLNIRKGTSTSQPAIGSVNSSDYIHILNKADNGWYAVETDTDQLGYVSGQYIDIQKAKGVINSNGVNVRASADYSAPVISQVYKNNVVYAHAKVGDWYLIQSGGQDGYIHRDFIEGALIDQLPNKKAAAPKKAAPTEKTIAVATTTINLREDSSTNSSIIQKVSPGEVLSVVQIGDEWVKVSTSDNKQGHLSKQYLNIGKESAKDELLEGVKKSTSQTSQTNQTSKTSKTSSSNKGDEVVAYAKQFIGNPYVYGGNSLTNGVDCSGFTSQVFKKFGVSLSRSSSAQYANNGTHVNSSDVRTGDLLFYGYGGKVSHVAIYIGNGQVVQASTPKTGINTGTAFRTSGKPLIGIKRVI